jgi:hypothetical protein
MYVVVEGDILRINGQVVAEPVKGTVKPKGARETISLRRIREVLGRHSRSGYGHNNLHYVWDDLGFETGEMNEPGDYADGHGPA